MSSGCGDVLSLVDLQTAKKHQIFEAEVITGKSGGVAGGADIDYATNQVTGQTQKTLPAILHDIGFLPAGFDFSTGGTLSINDRNKSVLWPSSSGGDDQYYTWQGVLPKVIPAASSPATTGGVAPGAWVQVSYLSLKTDLSSEYGSTLIGHGANTAADVLYAIPDVSYISGMQFTDKTVYSLRGWVPGQSVSIQNIGGGRFIYMASMPRANHNGGTVIDVSVPYTSTEDYLSGVGSSGGNGCLVRLDIKDAYLTSWFGALPSTTGVDAYASMQKCFDSANSNGMQILVTDSVAVSKPLVLKSQSILKGVSRYKTFILKTNSSTSGLPPIAKPGDAPGPVGDVTMDVDAVVIIAPYNSGEYATFIHIADISFENNANPANGVQPVGSFGIYAPFINLSSIERCQVYKVDVAIYSKTMWMTRLSQWRAFTVNHNVWVDQGGTSLSFENVWVQGCSYGAYYFKGVGYSNFIQMSADGLGNQTEFGGFAYRFLNCENCKALLSVEESDNTGVLSVESSVMDIQIQAKYGVRGGASTESLIAVVGSRVTFSESEVAPTSLGSMAAKFYGTSFITTNNSDFFNDTTAYTDDTTRIVNISDSLSISGRINGSPFKTTVGADTEMRGVWDSSGRLVFKSTDGAITYGVLFANSANNLLWKSGGYPASNTDGVKLN